MTGSVKQMAGLVTGASRGIGFHVAKAIIKRAPEIELFLTSRHDVRGLSSVMGFEIGRGARKNANFMSLDIRDENGLDNLQKKILNNYSGLDILINNAAVYYPPDTRPGAFSQQVDEILGTNYWGTKQVVNTFYPYLNPHARVINLTSNLATVENIEGESEAAMFLRMMFSSYLEESELDELMIKFARDAKQGVWREEGWPDCAYTVSKLAINSYTRILQEKLDRDKKVDCVVNAVYPCTSHSKINQKEMTLLDVRESARWISILATSNSGGAISGVNLPRGEVVWASTRVVEKIAEARKQIEEAEGLSL